MGSYWISLSRQIVGTYSLLAGKNPPGHSGCILQCVVKGEVHSGRLLQCAVQGEGDRTIFPGRCTERRGSLAGGNHVLIRLGRSKGDHGMLVRTMHVAWGSSFSGTVRLDILGVLDTLREWTLREYGKTIFFSPPRRKRFVPGSSQNRIDLSQEILI